MAAQGYVVDGQDNDSYAFRDESQAVKAGRVPRIQQSVAPDLSGAARPGPRRCPRCGALLTKFEEPLTGLVIKRRRYDLSATYDGIDVASKAFKELCTAHRLSGLEFIPLPDDSAFFQVRASKTVKLDPSVAEFENECPRCGRFESVVGGDPVLLRKGERIPPGGFVRTDLEFGSEDEKSPMLLCGVKVGEVLTAARLR